MSLLQSQSYPRAEPWADVAGAVRHETRSQGARPRIHLKALRYETLVFGHVVRQDFAHRKPTIHADGRVTVTWQGETRLVIAERWTLQGTTAEHVWFAFRLGGVVKAPSDAGSGNT